MTGREGGLVDLFLEQRTARIDSLRTPEALLSWRTMPSSAIESAFYDTPKGFQDATYAYLSRTEANVQCFLEEREAEGARLAASQEADVERVRHSSEHRLVLAGFTRGATLTRDARKAERGEGLDPDAYVARQREQFGPDAVVVTEAGFSIHDGEIHDLPEGSFTVYIRDDAV